MRNLVTLLMVLSIWVCQAQGLEFTGKAYDLKTNQLVYVEKQSVQSDENGFNTLIKTEYTRPSGEVFAKIQSDFKKDPFIPDVVFEDFRFSLRQEMTFDKEAKRIKILQTNTKTQKTTSKEIPLKPNMIAGQGFNNYILKNWDQLVAGKSLPLDFIVIAKQDFFSFELFRTPEKSKELLDISLKVKSVFLRAFVGTIETVYFHSDKRLKTFKGLSNLVDDKDQSLTVRIEYEYPK